MNYVALIRASFDADNEVEAAAISELVRFNAGMELYLDEDDDVSVIEVVEFNADMSHQELVLKMRATRNGLIKTKIKQCFELAQQIDQIAWILEHREDIDFAHTQYDYGRFMELTTEILQQNKNPET